MEQERNTEIDPGHTQVVGGAEGRGAGGEGGRRRRKWRSVFIVLRRLFLDLRFLGKLEDLFELWETAALYADIFWYIYFTGIFFYLFNLI